MGNPLEILRYIDLPPAGETGKAVYVWDPPTHSGVWVDNGAAWNNQTAGAASTILEVEDFGAVAGASGNAAANTIAIQAAIDAANAAGAGVVVLRGFYKVQTLQMKLRVTLLGNRSQSFNSVYGSGLLGTAGMNIIELDSGVSPYDAGSFYNLTFSGGLNQIYAQSTNTFVYIKNCVFASATGAALRMVEGSPEEWFVEDIYCVGCRWFLKIDSTVNLFDKSTFRNIVATGCETGVYMEPALCTVVVFENLTVSYSTQHGIYLDGGLAGVVFIDTNTEGNGTSGKRDRTTGTISSASNSLVVASGTGYAIGDTVTVKGAGANGFDLTSVATNVVGTTVTLTDNAGTSVTSVATTNAKYDDIHFSNVNATPADITFISGVIGGEATLGRLRYAVNLTGTFRGTFVGMRASTGIPVYDPTLTAVNLGSNIEYRATDLYTSESFRQVVITSGTAPRTTIPSPIGKDILLALRDSNDNGTGTYGKLSVRRYDSNRTELLRLTGSTGDFLTYGGVGPGDPGGGVVGNRIFYASAAPVAGTFARGDIVFNTTPSAAGQVGWTCVTAGTPGTWKTFGTIAA